MASMCGGRSGAPSNEIPITLCGLEDEARKEYKRLKSA